jgi:hypothetical protein
VFENGVYEVNGEHPTPGAGHVDFAAMARAAGYQTAVCFSELKAFEAELPALLVADGPVMVVLKIIPGEAYPRDYAYIHSKATREKFCAALNRSNG